MWILPLLHVDGNGVDLTYKIFSLNLLSYIYMSLGVTKIMEIQ